MLLSALSAGESQSSRMLLSSLGAREAAHATPQRARRRPSRVPGTKTTEEVLEDQITICE